MNPVGPIVLDPLKHIVELALVDQRLGIGLPIAGVADLAGGDAREQPGVEIVVDTVPDEMRRVAVHFCPADQNASA